MTREESKAATQEKLLEAATKAFARHGFAEVAVEDIAESAGFSRGAFYSNFKNKDLIFLALVEREVKTWTHETQQILAAFIGGRDAAQSSQVLCGHQRQR